jgi:hypothetical protein
VRLALQSLAAFNAYDTGVMQGAEFGTSFFGTEKGPLLGGIFKDSMLEGAFSRLPFVDRGGLPGPNPESIISDRVFSLGVTPPPSPSTRPGEPKAGLAVDPFGLGSLITGISGNSWMAEGIDGQGQGRGQVGEAKPNLRPFKDLFPLPPQDLI